MQANKKYISILAKKHPSTCCVVLQQSTQNTTKLTVIDILENPVKFFNDTPRASTLAPPLTL